MSFLSVYGLHSHTDHYKFTSEHAKHCFQTGFSGVVFAKRHLELSKKGNFFGHLIIALVEACPIVGGLAMVVEFLFAQAFPGKEGPMPLPDNSSPSRPLPPSTPTASRTPPSTEETNSLGIRPLSPDHGTDGGGSSSYSEPTRVTPRSGVRAELFPATPGPVKDHLKELLEPSSPPQSSERSAPKQDVVTLQRTPQRYEFRPETEPLPSEDPLEGRNRRNSEPPPYTPTPNALPQRDASDTRSLYAPSLPPYPAQENGAPKPHGSPRRHSISSSKAPKKVDPTSLVGHGARQLTSGVISWGIKLLVGEQVATPRPPRRTQSQEMGAVQPAPATPPPPADA